MSVHFRDYTPADYPGIAAVQSAVYPDYPETAENLREQDEKRDAARLFGRFVAEADGAVVGTAEYAQWPRDTPRFWVSVQVRPDARGKGIGKGLYEHLLGETARYEPTTLRAEVREDDERGVRFLHDRGFAVEMREKESALNVETFQPEVWAAEVERATAQGIVIQSYPEMKAAATDLEALHRAMYDLHSAVDEDIPNVDVRVPDPFEQWMKRFERTRFFAEGQFYAWDGDRLVGCSMLWKRPADTDLDTGMTGVRREYRKRGIATAVKVRALTVAKAYGAKTVRTTNEQDNVGMLGINYRLGFVPQPAWLFYGKKLRPEKPEESAGAA